MGLGPFGISSCSAHSCCSSAITEVDVPRITTSGQSSVDPDPESFNILGSWEYDNATVIKVHYPGCLNHEGVKILVFHPRLHSGYISSVKYLDPHFCNSVDHRSPFARFEPTVNGLSWARMIAKRL